MKSLLNYTQHGEGPAMIIVAESARSLKGYLAQCNVKERAVMMFMRLVLAFILHRGRMSCSAAAVSICSEAVHRGEVTRFLAQVRWRKFDFNEPLVRALIARSHCEAHSYSLLTRHRRHSQVRKRKTPTCAVLEIVHARRTTRTNATTKRKQLPRRSIASRLAC